jgi:protein TonB
MRPEKKLVIRKTKEGGRSPKGGSLNTLLGVSLGIHLLIFSSGFLIVADVTVNPGPMPPVEVSLLLPILSPMVAEKRLTKPKILTEDKRLPRETEEETPREEPILKTLSEPERPLPLQAAVPPVQATPLQPAPVQREEEAPLPPSLEVVSTPNPSLKKEAVRVAVTDPGSRESTAIVLPMAPPTAPPAAPATDLPSASFPERSVSLPASPPSDEKIISVRPRYGENPKPVYPAEARKKGYQGEVLLRAEVLSNGRVGDVELKKSSGHEILDRSALAAVKQWKFIPAREGEKTIAVWVNIPVKFQLQ